MSPADCIAIDIGSKFVGIAIGRSSDGSCFPLGAMDMLRQPTDAVEAIKHRTFRYLFIGKPLDSINSERILAKLGFTFDTKITVDEYGTTISGLLDRGSGVHVGNDHAKAASEIMKLGFLKLQPR